MDFSSSPNEQDVYQLPPSSSPSHVQVGDGEPADGEPTDGEPADGEPMDGDVDRGPSPALAPPRRVTRNTARKAQEVHINAPPLVSSITNALNATKVGAHTRQKTKARQEALNQKRGHQPSEDEPSPKRHGKRRKVGRHAKGQDLSDDERHSSSQDDVESSPKGRGKRRKGALPARFVNDSDHEDGAQRSPKAHRKAGKGSRKGRAIDESDDENDGQSSPKGRGKRGKGRRTAKVVDDSDEDGVEEEEPAPGPATRKSPRKVGKVPARKPAKRGRRR